MLGVHQPTTGKRKAEIAAKMLRDGAVIVLVAYQLYNLVSWLS